MVSFTTLSTAFLVGVALASQGKCSSKKPNIILIMSDDQDRLMDSCDYMPTLQRELVAKGTSFTNHYATVSNCCPSRASFLRGQAAHNTNITHVRPPGGNYDKWMAAGEDENYLPHWIKSGGYRAECVGKFLNGYNTANYQQAPKGWDHIDSLLEPYIGDFNNPVFSANGERPVVYRDFHQTDVVRAKAIDRLSHLLDNEEPFFLNIAPYAPHVSGPDPPMPATRHLNLYNNVSVPRFANWNPSDDIQRQKSMWIKDLPLLNSTQEDYADYLYQRRLQSLVGVDEIIEDVIRMLEERGYLDNTYVIYTTDNGYHIGTHRLPAGKALPYVMDSNLPLVVRGPGIPENVVSDVASAHLDFAPTFLDMMGLPQSEWPSLLDGRSLLHEWQSGEDDKEEGDAKEILNIEFWGDKIFEAPSEVPWPTQNSYKTLRIVSEGSSWLFVKWCSNEIELYNTTADPWEIDNLAYPSPSVETARIITRLNALLLVTKSCEANTCRNPWIALQPPASLTTKPINSLTRALDPLYDSFFASFPEVQFKECNHYQDVENERPYWPEGAEKGLGMEWRVDTTGWTSTKPNGTTLPSNKKPAGGEEQRFVTMQQLEAGARELTYEELGHGDDEGDENGGGPGVRD